VILPNGYTARAAAQADFPAIHAMVAAGERSLAGHSETDLDRVAADLSRPGLILDRDSLVVHDAGGELAARAWVNRRSEVDVALGHRGRGLGAALADWVLRQAAAAGTPEVTQTVPDADRAAVELLESRGWTPKVVSWLLEINSAAEPDVPPAPAGITVRSFRQGDDRAAHQLIEDAFDDWQQRRSDFDEWRRLTVDRATFAPALSPVAFDGEAMVGAVIALDDPARGEGYIERLAVRRDHRNRGLARLLLRRTFRDFHRAGRKTCTLWTHSDTGALSLYERIGMTVRRSSTVYRHRVG
jgi:mycothiol synthase